MAARAETLALMGETSPALTAPPAPPVPGETLTTAPPARLALPPSLRELRLERDLKFRFGVGFDDVIPSLGEFGWRIALAWPLLGSTGLPSVGGSAGNSAETLFKGAAFRPLQKLGRLELPSGTLAVDLHVHTCYSHDSLADPEEILLTAAARGLSGIAVTDHDTMEGVRHVQDAAASLIAAGKLPATFFVLPGQEISSADGHIVALFLTRRLPGGLSATDTLAAIHEQGGIALAAHPMIASGTGPLAKALPFDAVETENGAEELEFGPASKGKRAARDDFYAGVTAPRVGGSDAHDPEVVSFCYTELHCAPEAAAAEAEIRAGRTAARCRLTPEELRALTSRGLTGKLMALGAGYKTVTDNFRSELKRATGADAITITYFPDPGLVWHKSF